MNEDKENKLLRLKQKLDDLRSKLNSAKQGAIRAMHDCRGDSELREQQKHINFIGRILEWLDAEPEERRSK